jgi:hypothetical protein
LSGTCRAVQALDAIDPHGSGSASQTEIRQSNDVYACVAQLSGDLR